MVDPLLRRHADAERDPARDLAHDRVDAAERVEVGAGQFRARGLVSAADVEAHARRGDVAFVSDAAADRLRVARVMVGAEHPELGVARRHAALELLEAALIDVAERLDVHVSILLLSLQIDKTPDGMNGRSRVAAAGLASRPRCHGASERCRAAVAGVGARCSAVELRGTMWVEGSNPHQPVSETGASARLRHIRRWLMQAPAWPAWRGALVGARVSVAPGEVGDELRRRGVEAHDVEHPRVGGIGDGERVGDHPDHYQPCVHARHSAVVAERPRRVDVSGPGLRVGVVTKASISIPLACAYSIGSAQSVPPNGRSDTAFTASSSRCRGEIASGVRPSSPRYHCRGHRPPSSLADLRRSRRSRRPAPWLPSPVERGRRIPRQSPGTPATQPDSIEPDTSSARSTRLPVGVTFPNDE